MNSEHQWYGWIKCSMWARCCWWQQHAALWTHHIFGIWFCSTFLKLWNEFTWHPGVCVCVCLWVCAVLMAMVMKNTIKCVRWMAWERYLFVISHVFIMYHCITSCVYEPSSLIFMLKFSSVYILQQFSCSLIVCWYFYSLMLTFAISLL